MAFLVWALLLSSGCEKSNGPGGDPQAAGKAASGFTNKDDVFSGLSYERAMALAASEKKLVMMDFTAEWCGWCKKLDADTWSNSEVRDWLKKNAVCIKVDVDQLKPLAAQYKVGPIPDVRFVDATGKEVKKIEGYVEAKEFLKQVASLAK